MIADTQAMAGWKAAILFHLEIIMILRTWDFARCV